MDKRTGLQQLVELSLANDVSVWSKVCTIVAIPVAIFPFLSFLKVERAKLSVFFVVNVVLTNFKIGFTVLKVSYLLMSWTVILNFVLILILYMDICDIGFFLATCLFDNLFLPTFLLDNRIRLYLEKMFSLVLMWQANDSYCFVSFVLFQYFNQILTIVLEVLDYPDNSTRELALSLIVEMLKNQVWLHVAVSCILHELCYFCLG